MPSFPLSPPGVVFWDSEALQTKPESMDFGRYKTICGVSVACVIESGTPTFYTAADREGYNLLALGERLEAADLVVSYNGLRWDTPVLSETLRRALSLRECDLWDEIKRTRPRRDPAGTWKLGAVCQRTLGETKAAEGAFAPSLWADRQIGRLFTYCYRDVWLTWRLYEHILERGFVVGLDGGHVRLELERR